MGRGRYCACQLAALVQKFLDDHTFLPVNPYGDWNQTMLIDEDLSNDINLYLQEIGKDISVKKVVNFLAQEEVKQKHGITKAISEQTARWYLNALGYPFCTAKVNMQTGMSTKMSLLSGSHILTTVESP